MAGRGPSDHLWPGREEHGVDVTHGSDCQGGLVRGESWHRMQLRGHFAPADCTPPGVPALAFDREVSQTART